MSLISTHARLDRRTYKEVIKYCKKNGLLIRVLIEKALVEKLDRDGRYVGKFKA